MRKMNKDLCVKASSKLQTFFMPMHEHLGFENAKTTYDIQEYLREELNLNKKHENNCVYFKQWFSSFVTQMVHTSILNPRSKYFLKGLVCETMGYKKGKLIGTGKIGYYYYLKNMVETKRVIKVRQDEINAQKMMTTNRVIINGGEHLKSIGVKDNEKLMIE